MTNKAIRVRDLQDQLGMGYPRPILRCFSCGVIFSAHSRDYFVAQPDTIFKHCGRNMRLVIKRTVYEEAQV